MQVKKFYIRVLAILMAVTIAVTTPLSDFADIKGVKQTHAVAPALITLGGLFGAIAGAYGLYVAVDKLGDYAENWFNWTADNATDARSDLQKIKDGVTGYVITKAVSKSVADFLATKVSDDYSYTLQGVADKHSYLDSSRLESSYHQDFEYLLQSDALPRCDTYIPVFYYWEPSTNSDYADGTYNIYAFSRSDVEAIRNSDGVVDVIFYTIKNPSTGALSLICSGFDSSGCYVSHIDKIVTYNMHFISSTLKWSSNKLNGLASTLLGTTRVIDSHVLAQPHSYALPVYETDFPTFSIVRSLDEIKTNSYATKSITVDYKTHGNNALDNANALEGAEVTQAQLEAIQQAVEKEYSNVVQFPNSGGDNEEEPDTQALANAITLAVLSTLQNMGYIKNPTDEPSGENVKEQLGKIEIAVDGMTDAMAQNNRLLENVFDAVQGLASNIGNAVSVAFQNALDALFVPDTEAVESLTNDFFDKFPWTHTLFDYTDDIKKAFLSSEPPKIYIHFQDSKDSKYHSIGTQLAFDASWYAPYKPTGDMILSVFIYALFLWRLFKNIPNIMSGLGMMTEQSIRFEDNMVKNGKG